MHARVAGSLSCTSKKFKLNRYLFVVKLFKEVVQVLEFQFASQRECGAERLNPTASGIC